MRRYLRSAVLAALLTACSDGTAPEPTDVAHVPDGPLASVVNFGFTQIGTVEQQIRAVAVNDAGQAAGTSHSQEPDTRRPFIWENGGISFPTTLGGEVRDMNSAGAMVGAFEGHPVVWTPAGQRTELAGTDGGDARAITDAGMIVGAGRVPGGSSGALVWSDALDPAPTILALPGGLPSGASGAGLGASSRGRIVGSVSYPAGEDKVEDRAMVWLDQLATGQELAGFAGGFCVGVALTVNELDEIVGACDGIPAYWADPDAAPVDLTGRAGRGAAYSINELGQVVGELRDPGNPTTIVHPRLWMREGDAFREFALASPSGGAAARAISNRGRVAGDGASPLAGYVWTIPVAATIAVAPAKAGAFKLDGKGAVAVTIAGSQWLHVAGIDPETLTLGNDDGLETAPVRKKSKFAIRTSDVDGDGFMDMIVEFEERALMNHGDLADGQQLIYLLGRFRDGTHIRGAAALP